MLKVFDEFRERLDQTMRKAFGRRIVLWGYGYTGRFLEWYAEYYHSLKADFIITQDWTAGQPFNFPLFRDSLFDFDYMDVKDAVVWLAIPAEKPVKEKLSQFGYIRDESYFDFYDVIYGGNYICEEETVKDIFQKKKTGVSDIQFMEWLEYVYDCNFVTAIESTDFHDRMAGAHSYRMTAQKEIFPILDKCHCIPGASDAIFDFGCGKGGAMISFLDYGFQRVGGVEFESGIYEALTSNFQKLGIEYGEDKNVVCIHGDAREVQTVLDGYNWFYFFDPFQKDIFKKVIDNICESLKRKPRRVHIININPKYHEIIVKSGCFVLDNQFCVAMRQRVVDVFVTKLEGDKIRCNLNV